MITPKQNAVVMDDLDIRYFVNRHSDDTENNCQTVAEQAAALIKCDRQLAQFEQHNWDMASTHRRDSIFLKIIKLWGTRK